MATLDYVIFLSKFGNVLCKYPSEARGCAFFGPRRAAGSGHYCRLPSLAVYSSVRLFHICHRSLFLYCRLCVYALDYVIVLSKFGNVTRAKRGDALVITKRDLSFPPILTLHEPELVYLSEQ